MLPWHTAFTSWAIPAFQQRTNGYVLEFRMARGSRFLLIAVIRVEPLALVMLDGPQRRGIRLVQDHAQDSIKQRRGLRKTLEDQALTCLSPLDDEDKTVAVPRDHLVVDDRSNWRRLDDHQVVGFACDIDELLHLRCSKQLRRVWRPIGDRAGQGVKIQALFPHHKFGQRAWVLQGLLDPYLCIGSYLLRQRLAIEITIDDKHARGRLPSELCREIDCNGCLTFSRV